MSIDTYFCLCCLSTDQLINMFEENSEGNLPVILKDLFCIKPSEQDADDTYICNECVNKLTAAADFKKQVFNNMNVMQEMALINLRKESGILVIKKVRIAIDEEKPETEFIDVNIHNNNKENPEKSEPLQLYEEEEMDIVEENIIIEHLDETDIIQVPKDLSCKHCDKILPNVYGYNEHLKTHFPNHVCEVCGKVFVTAKSLKRHKASHKIGPFVCDCGKEFHNYNTYNDHKRSKHTGALKYSCLKCPSRFASVTHRARHMAEEHQCDVTLTCDECGKIFISSIHLNNHVKYHHLKLKRHACTTCDAKFYHKQDLQGHMAKHTGVFEFVCQDCDKRFPRKKALEMHKKIHTNDRKDVGCDTCGKRYIQRSSLIIHQKVHNRADNGKLKGRNAKVRSNKGKVKRKLKVETKVIGQNEMKTVTCSEQDEEKYELIKVIIEDNNQSQLQEIKQASEVDMNEKDEVNTNSKVGEIAKVEVAKVDDNKAKVNVYRNRHLVMKPLNSENKPLLFNSYKLFY